MPDPHAATKGMKGAGYYDAHSEYQRRILEAGDGAIRSIVGELDLELTEAALTVADYGAGTGATSVHAVATALDAVRARAPEQAVQTVHNDLPSSDFNQLFANVTGPGGYLSTRGGPVYPAAAAGSFFDQVVPSQTVELGMCSNAAHWYRRQPEAGPFDGMYFADAPDGVRRGLAEQAEGDWLSFLRARAAELAPGGRLLVQGIGADAEIVSAARLLRAMWTTAALLADEGLLDPEVLRSYVFPVYCRSAAEATAPAAAGGGLEGALGVVSVEVEDVPDPYWELLERDGDREAYADVYTAFVRAFSESSLTDGLFGPGAPGEEPAALCDAFFARFRDNTAQSPEDSRYEARILRVVFERPR